MQVSETGADFLISRCGGATPPLPLSDLSFLPSCRYPTFSPSFAFQFHPSLLIILFSFIFSIFNLFVSNTFCKAHRGASISSCQGFENLSNARRTFDRGCNVATRACAGRFLWRDWLTTDCTEPPSINVKPILQLYRHKLLCSHAHWLFCFNENIGYSAAWRFIPVRRLSLIVISETQRQQTLPD